MGEGSTGTCGGSVWVGGRFGFGFAHAAGLTATAAGDRVARLSAGPRQGTVKRGLNHRWQGCCVGVPASIPTPVPSLSGFTTDEFKNCVAPTMCRALSDQTTAFKISPNVVLL